MEDADDISKIYGAITQPSDRFEFKNIIEEQVKRDEGACFSAELNGSVVGYIICYVLSGGFGINKSAWIANVGVDPRYMGQGIGDRLAQEVFTVFKAKGIKTIYTSVRWDSTDLLSFFKRLGFDRSNFINLRKHL